MRAVTMAKGCKRSSFGNGHFFPLKEAHFSAYLLPPPISLRNPWAHQFQEALSRGLSRRETGDAIDDFSACLAIFGYGAREAKDLSDACPLPTQEVIEFGGGHQLADL